MDLEGSRRVPELLAWSPDGRLVAGADNGRSHSLRSIGIWDAKTGRRVHLLENIHEGECGELAWSPDGLKFATCGDDCLVKIWKTSTCVVVQSLAGHEESVGWVRWSPDGRWLASSDASGKITLWDTDNWSRSWTIPRLEDAGSFPAPLAWNPDSKQLASQVGRGRLVVWDVSSDHEPVLAWSATPHTAPIRYLAWHPAGSRIVTYSRDRHAKIWDAATGREMLSLNSDSLERFDGWSPSGRQLLTAGFTDATFAWDASPAMIAAQAKQVPGRRSDPPPE